MTDQPSTASSTAAATIPKQSATTQGPMQTQTQGSMESKGAPDGKALRTDIGRKWGKFSSQELTDLRDNDDLVTQLVAKYGLEKEAATRDAAAVVRGRTF